MCRGYPGTQQTTNSAGFFFLKLAWEQDVGLGLVAPVITVAFPNFDFWLSSGTRKYCFYS